MGRATAQIEITAGSSRLGAGLSAALSQFKTFSGSVARGMGAAFKGLNKHLAPGETMKNAAGHAGGDLMGRGMDALVDGAQNVRNFERSLVRMKIATDGNTASTAAMRRAVKDVSSDTGIVVDQVLAGASAYVGFTGDAAGATDAMKLFADVAVATGASTADAAQAMAALKTSMGITAKEGEAAFSALIVQGKGGAVEVKDLAGELAALAPRFALFKGGKNLGGLREMGAGFQVIMKNSATAGDAATKYRALMESLSDPRTLKQLNAMGIKVKDNKGKLLDASTVFHRLAESKTLFAKENLSKAFGRSEAQTAVLALKENIKTYDDLRIAAEDTGAVQRDKMTYLNEDAGRLDKAFNNVKVAIMEAFTPERIHGFVKAIESLVEKIGPVVEAVSFVGDKLGSLYGAGKSVRGFLSGGANPFNGEIARGSFGIMQSRDPAQALKNLENAKANHRGFDRGSGRILGQERDDKTTPESIRAAYIASMSRGGGEALGESRAGDMYLSAAGVTKAQAADQFGKDMLKIQEEGYAKIAAAIAAAQTTVQIGDHQVARAAEKSVDARRRPH